MSPKRNKPTDMRRSDRAVEDEAWIKRFLLEKNVGILATSFGEQPFINSNLYVYDEGSHSIYIHTARTGRTRDNIDANPQACFHVFEMGRLLPAEEALEFSIEYAGVTIFGEIQTLQDATQEEHILQLILDKYAPHLQKGRDYRGITPEELKRTAVYKLAISSWSAKKKQVEADFPGAFALPETSFLG
jgi:hypothetical protein